MTNTIGFKVVGGDRIHCAGCEQRIANALRRLPGVHHVQASAQSQQVAVTFDPVEVNPERVRARIEELGYEVVAQGGGG